MHLQRKVRNAVRGLLQAYGTQGIKRQIWDNEFSGGRWDCLDDTRGDCVYPILEKHAAGGSILDLGCGTGSTANELDPRSYAQYTGVDISDVAIEKARSRSEAAGRGNRHRYAQSDIYSYTPDATFDVILFRDSIYYIPRARIAGMLERYARHLRDGGVFIVRMASGTDTYAAILSAIESRFDVIEQHISEQPKAVVVVFSPRARTSRGH